MYEPSLYGEDLVGKRELLEVDYGNACQKRFKIEEQGGIKGQEDRKSRKASRARRTGKTRKGKFYHNKGITRVSGNESSVRVECRSCNGRHILTCGTHT